MGRADHLQQVHEVFVIFTKSLQVVSYFLIVMLVIIRVIIIVVLICARVRFLRSILLRASVLNDHLNVLRFPEPRLCTTDITGPRTDPFDSLAERIIVFVAPEEDNRNSFKNQPRYKKGNPLI